MMIGGWIFQIDLLMCRVHITTDEHHTAFVHLLFHFLEETVIEAQFKLHDLRAASAVREIDVIEDKVTEVDLDRSSLVVKFILAEAVGDRYRLPLRVHCGTGISFSLRRGKITLISGDVQKAVIELVHGRLCFLDAEDVRVEFFYRIEKALLRNCTDAVYIPTN